MEKDEAEQPTLANLSVAVHRVLDGQKTTVFAYVGDVDAARIADVLDHVERLCATGGGEWQVEVESTRSGPPLFRAMTQRFLSVHEGDRERIVVAAAPRKPAVPASAAAQWFRPFPQAPW